MVLKDVRPIIAELVRLKKSIPLWIDVHKNVHGEGVRSGIKKALRLIEQAPTIKAEPKWISVEDGLPEKFSRVLAACCMGVFEVVYDGKYWCKDGIRYKDTFTHWMPLPNAPEEESR